MAQVGDETVEACAVIEDVWESNIRGAKGLSLALNTELTMIIYPICLSSIHSFQLIKLL